MLMYSKLKMSTTKMVAKPQLVISKRTYQVYKHQAIE